MGETPAKYWDLEQCAWVKCPAPPEAAVVPAQAQPPVDEDARAVEIPVVGTGQ